MVRMEVSAWVWRADHFLDAVLEVGAERGTGRPRWMLSWGEKLEREVRQPVAQMMTSAGIEVPEERTSEEGEREAMSQRWMCTLWAIVSQKSGRWFMPVLSFCQNMLGRCEYGFVGGFGWCGRSAQIRDYRLGSQTVHRVRCLRDQKPGCTKNYTN